MLTNDDICSIMKDHSNFLIPFISVYNYEKGMLNVNCDVLNELMDVQEENNENDLNTMNCSTSSCSAPVSANNSVALSGALVENLASQANNSQVPIVISEFEYTDNDLYRLLNSTLPGKVILGVYKHTKKLKLTNLIDIITYECLKQDTINYK